MNATTLPATVALKHLRDLWVHTGTACNLECPFCLEGSKPGDTRIDRLTLNELKPIIDDAVSLGVERFCFTGGEPLIVKDIVKILHYALQVKPCLVLTNGTAPLIKRVHQLQMLKVQPHAIEFRVSIDQPDEKAHDAERGWGNFKRALEGLGALQKAGFKTSIASHIPKDHDIAAMHRAFKEVLVKARLDVNTPIATLPELGRPGTHSDALPVLPTELDEHHTQPMCARSRMVLRREGSIRVQACALTDDDSRFDLGPSLRESLSRPVLLLHHRCRLCIGPSACDSASSDRCASTAGGVPFGA